MPTEVLTQLRALRESIAETLRKDPRFLTLSALDKSIAEITGVLSNAGLIPAEPAQPTPLHFDAPRAAPAAPASPATPEPAPQSLSAAAVPQPQPVAPQPAMPSPPPIPSYPTAAPVATAQQPVATTPFAPLASPAADQLVAAPPVAAPSPPAPSPAAPASAPTVAPDAAAVAPVANGVKKKKSLLKPALGVAAALSAAGIVAEVVHLSRGKPKDEPEAPKVNGEAKEPDMKHESIDEVPAKADELPVKADPALMSPQADAAAARAPMRAARGDAPPDVAESGGGAGDVAAAGGGDAAAAGENAVIPEGKAGGYVPMKAKEGATQYQPAISVKFGKLPNKVDLRPLMTAIEDQGATSSCVANAVAGAYEYWIKKATKKDQNVSRLFVYYNARWRDGSQDKDDGSVIQLAMEGLSKFGACDETVWPFDTNLVTKKPGASAYENGAPWKVQDMAQVPLKLEAWKQALAEGKPIVFGIALFGSFDECSKRGGVVAMPSPEDVARASHSGHSMCAVGYSDTEKVFIVRNSWGADWGDQGYCYMPYAYLLNPKFNDGDCWVFVPKVPMQPPREVWFDDTKPVTNDGRGVDFTIETFKIEDYEHVVFDFFERVRKPFNTFIGEDFCEYVSFASKSLWSSMQSFDYKTFLASTAALTGVVVATSAIASEFSSTTSSSETSTSSSSTSSISETSSSSSSETSSSSDSVRALSESESDAKADAEQDADATADEDQDEDEAADEDAASDADQDEDEAADEDAASDADQDEDEAADEDAASDADQDEDEAADEDAASDEDQDEDEAADGDAASDEDKASDEDQDEDEAADEDKASDEDQDEDADEDETADEDAASDEDADEDEAADEDEDEASDEDDSGEDDDSDEDESDEDDGGDDEDSDDGGDDDGGDDDGGDDGGDDD